MALEATRNQTPHATEWKLVHDIADAGVPALTAALQDTWNGQQSRIDVESLAASIQATGVDNIDWRVELGALQGAMVSVCGPIARDVALTLLPRYETPTEVYADWIDLALDLRFMEAEKFLQRYLPNLIVRINDETRRAIREAILYGFQNGRHPYEMAEEIAKMVGMTPGQVRAYRRFAANILAGSMAPARQAIALAEFRNRAIHLRARNIARTETLRAANAGQQALWRLADANGLLGPAKRMWINTPGERTCPACRDMGGELANIDGVFIADGFGVEAPPLHPSCRCAMGLVFP